MNDNKLSYVLFEGVLNDDMLHIAYEGKVFKGGYVAVIEYYTYLNGWNNKKHYKYFRNLITLEKYIAKKYPDYQDNGVELYQFNDKELK